VRMTDMSMTCTIANQLIFDKHALGENHLVGSKSAKRRGKAPVSGLAQNSRFDRTCFRGNS
jgi:hypothetical protein